MKQFTAQTQVETASSERYAWYVGLDVHKHTMAVALAYPGRGEPGYRGEIANPPKAMAKLIKRLSKETGGGLMCVCYEAGPGGDGLYRQLMALGHACEVVAPLRIPRTPGERIKTDRRDALKLAQLLRAGDLTAVWVPDTEQEAMRDMSRAAVWRTHSGEPNGVPRFALWRRA